MNPYPSPLWQSRGFTLGAGAIAVAVAAVAMAAFALSLASHPGAGTLAASPSRHLFLSPMTLFGATAVIASERARPVYIAGGKFRMGASAEDVTHAVALCLKEPIADDCSPSRFALERPSHMVAVQPFVIDSTEVTVEEYYRCVDLGRCEAPHFARGGLRFDLPKLPITFVSWQQASDYCSFRYARLPTEPEWERAARGTASRRFPWGNTWNVRRANHGRLGLVREDDHDGFLELAPVGSYPSGSTATGIHDLAGNVSEWVADQLGDYPASAPGAAKTSRRVPAQPMPRVIRGGDFVSAAPWLRSTARRGRHPDRVGADVGFRCARDVRVGVR